MTKIFLSYRRSDCRHVSERICDRLAARFGNDNVFKDVDSIPLGQDFRPVLDEAVGQCAALLAVIGPRWLTVTDEAGRRRLDDPDDYVRLEVERALARGIPVIPVLVDSAALPKPSELPASLQPLSHRQATQVRPDPDFQHDADRLIEACAKIDLPPPAPGFFESLRAWWAPKPIAAASGALVVLALIIAGVLLAGRGTGSPRETPAAPPEQPGTNLKVSSPEATVQAAAPVQIKLLEISHHRGEKAERLGKVGTTSREVRFNDDVRVHAELSGRAYCYLIAFNPDGKEQLCYPRADDLAPEAVDKLDYPADNATYFSLTDGLGEQAFVLLAKREPLPPYRNWRTADGAALWHEKIESNEIWRFDGQKLAPVAPDRGQERERSGPPGVLRQLCEFFKNVKAIDAVHVTAFPVTPEKK